MPTARSLLIVSAILEGILAIPILGGSIVVGLYYIPLTVMLIIHIITLIFVLKEKLNPIGSVIGIITSLIAWIPLVGWLMHFISAIVLLFIFLISKSKQTS